MTQDDVRFLAKAVEKFRDFVKRETPAREDIIEKQAEEIISSYGKGDIEVEDLSPWPQRLDVPEGKFMEFIYSQLMIKNLEQTRKFDYQIEKGVFKDMSRDVPAPELLRYKESLTEYCIPDFLDYISEFAPRQIRRFERAEELADEFLREKEVKLSRAEKQRFQTEVRIIGEIKKLVDSFEDRELKKQRKRLREIDKELEYTRGTGPFLGTSEDFSPASIGIKDTSENEELIEERKEILKKRREETPEEKKEKINRLYQRLEKLVENSEEVRKDIEVLEKEDVFE